MSDKINPVRPGDKLKAATVNKPIKSIGQMNAPHVSATAADLRMSPGTNDNLIKIKNNTDSILYRMHVVSVNEITNEPKEGEEISYLDGVVFVAEKPNLEKPVALVVEPIKPGMIGLAMIYGVYQAKVRMQDDDHRYATVIDDDVTLLESAAAGPFTLIWKAAEDSSHVSHCFVQFPSAASVVEGQGGFRQHAHADNTYNQGGLAFSCFSPGCSIPAMGFE